MPGNYNTHLDRFGLCQCDNRSGTEYMDLEVEDEYGRFRTKKTPACADCFGLV